MGEEQEKELAVFDPEQMVTMDNYVARESIPVSR